MAFYRRSDLQQRPLYEARATAERYHRKTASSQHYIFLSHSHLDGDLVLSAAALIGEYANAIYIDWKDESMPKVTNAVTARRIKAKIAETSKFILLATNNALSSKWVPWELGIADQSNGMSKVLIFPVEDPPHTWLGNEYIGIYSYVDRRDSTDGSRRNEPAVIDPETGKGEWLSDWLTK